MDNNFPSLINRVSDLASWISDVGNTMTAICNYPKGDLRRMLAVLGAIDAGHTTLVKIVAATGLDKKTVTNLVEQAKDQAGVLVTKDVADYRIDNWGDVLRSDGIKRVFSSAKG